MQKLTLKIENLFDSIIHSSNYKQIEDNDKYTNRLQPQQEIYKNVLIPKVKQEITELTQANSEFELIKIDKVIGKYNKTEKSLKIELVYNDEKENIYYIHKVLENFRREIDNRLLKYELYVM